MHPFVPVSLSAIITRRSMSDSPPELFLNADDLRAMAAAAGIALSAQRAAELVSQAKAQFALMRALDGVANPATEPAAEFRLDTWRRGDDD
jgi:hypothetical protein